MLSPRKERLVRILGKPVLRVSLAVLAVLLLVVGWLISPLVPDQDWAFLARNGDNFQRLASIPAALWALVEAVRTWLQEQLAVRDADVQEQFDEILVELENTCASLAIPARTYHCGITVWQLQDASPEDERAGEKRRRLKTVAIRRVRYKRRTSGLKWRSGMGVIGTSLERNTRLAVDVDDVWKNLRGCAEEQWTSQPADVRQGLTYSEFQVAVAGSAGSDEPAGQFVLAVPVWKGNEPLGVVALDTPPEMGRAARESRVADLLYAVGTYVLMR